MVGWILNVDPKRKLLHSDKNAYVNFVKETLNRTKNRTRNKKVFFAIFLLQPCI